MASPVLNEHYIELAKEHRRLAAVTTGAVRLNHWGKADQFERLAGLRDLSRHTG